MLPSIIQGGMGVAVSDWRLARAVSQTGQLGVVSGTALGTVLLRRLQDGDPDGTCRHALAHFPLPAMAARILSEYFIPGGKPSRQPYRLHALPTLEPADSFLELSVAGTFVEVFLAKEGHSGVVGLNLLEKIQLATLPLLYGAMLAGVDVVLMGAGIPRSIPGVLEAFARGEAAEIRIDVAGAGEGETFVSRFDPAGFLGRPAPELRRPLFLAIVASATLAMTLARKSNGRVDGFVVEGETAGGHNAPPRGPLQLNPAGEPVYGPRDVPDLEKIRELGLPFWLAGSFGREGRLAEALSLGAAGIQVGTAFAYCTESGLRADLREQVLAACSEGTLRVFTDPRASPTGFPFKVVQLPGTLSDAALYEARERICDLGYLRQPYRRADGTVGYRCGGEPTDVLVQKGGTPADAEGRKCICNALMAAAGFPQVRADGQEELPILTAGNDVERLAAFLANPEFEYSAADVVKILLEGARPNPTGTGSD